MVAWIVSGWIDGKLAWPGCFSCYSTRERMWTVLRTLRKCYREVDWRWERVHLRSR